MFQRLPKPLEIALFVVMALICASVVLASPKKDSALFFASVPLFLVSAIMGFRRNPQNVKRAEPTLPTALAPEPLEDPA